MSSNPEQAALAHDLKMLEDAREVEEFLDDLDMRLLLKKAARDDD
jgi:hypothetical protein